MVFFNGSLSQTVTGLWPSCQAKHLGGGLDGASWSSKHSLIWMSVSPLFHAQLSAKICFLYALASLKSCETGCEMVLPGD